MYMKDVIANYGGEVSEGIAADSTELLGDFLNRVFLYLNNTGRTLYEAEFRGLFPASNVYLIFIYIVRLLNCVLLWALTVNRAVLLPDTETSW